MGRSDLFLKLEIIKKIVGLISILITMWFGVMAMAYSLLVTSVLSQIINSWPNKKLLNYSYVDQLKDIFPQIGLTLIMAAIVYCVEFIGLGNIPTLIIQILIGIVIYVTGSKLFHIDSFEYILSTLKGMTGRKTKKGA